jgi:hypothetical protein
VLAERGLEGAQGLLARTGSSGPRCAAGQTDTVPAATLRKGDVVSRVARARGAAEADVGRSSKRTSRDASSDSSASRE